MNRGDVVLVEVPFVGSPGSKRRPAVIVQSNRLNGVIRETIIAAITSNLGNVHQPHHIRIDLSTPEGAASGLLMDSAVRCERLHTVPQADVRHVIGHLLPPLLTKLDSALKSALQLS